jgi:hypothetical protein
MIAVARVADRTRCTSTAAATSIFTGARATPRLGFMVLADPARSAAHLAFRRHAFSFLLLRPPPPHDYAHRGRPRSLRRALSFLADGESRALGYSGKGR